MPAITDPMLNEFRQEVATTRRVLERVPEQKLSWKPHEKSMTLGQLASHIASVPGSVARIVQQDSFDVNQGNFVPPQPKNLREVFTTFEQSARDAEQCLQTMTDDQAQRELALAPRKSGIDEFAAHRLHSHHHAESLVPPSRSVIGVP